MNLEPAEQRDISTVNDTVSRRRFLQLASVAALSGVVSACHSESKSILSVPPGQSVARFPEKTELILLTDRPPLLELSLIHIWTDTVLTR